jgi:hypothetical protein
VSRNSSVLPIRTRRGGAANGVSEHVSARFESGRAHPTFSRSRRSLEKTWAQKIVERIRAQRTSEATSEPAGAPEPSLRRPDGRRFAPRCVRWRPPTERQPPAARCSIGSGTARAGPGAGHG